MNEENIPKPVMLIVLDGWGLSDDTKGNALTKAQLPTFRKMDEYYPSIALQASGISVGLPWGEPGNSEVGHMTLGAGKALYQSMPRITMAIQSGEFFQNPSFIRAITHTKEFNSAMHIMGLIGKGGIHSFMDHLYALIELMKKENVTDLYLHVFTDGRDSPPTSGIENIKELEHRLKNYGVGKIASISGRYFAMDRNNNWDRIKKAYDAMVLGQGEQIENVEEYLTKSYAKEIFDEYIEPAVVVTDEQPVGKPVGLIKDNDSIIFFNFREDRARQLTKAFVLPGFSKFNRPELKNIHFVAMTQYEDNLPMDVAFGPVKITKCLGEILSLNKKTQLRIAETEKFAHVTYFFNGGVEEPFPGEDRAIIPSKAVSTFAEAPEMSAPEITEKLLELLETKDYDFILLNFANADIVGHTGNEKAAIEAVETVDDCMEKIIRAVIAKKGCLLITADHGNVEEMVNSKTGEMDTEHSANPVPLWYITPTNHSSRSREVMAKKISGLLSDVAPTILQIMKIEKPVEMTGESLLEVLK